MLQCVYVFAIPRVNIRFHSECAVAGSHVFAGAQVNVPCNVYVSVGGGEFFRLSAS